MIPYRIESMRTFLSTELPERLGPCDDDFPWKFLTLFVGVIGYLINVSEATRPT